MKKLEGVKLMTQPIKANALDKLNMEVLAQMGGHAGLLRGWKEIAGFLRVHKMTAMQSPSTARCGGDSITYPSCTYFRRYRHFSYLDS